MHIPDGYLSPSTCVALYAASAPFWYVAMQRLKRLLHSRTLPLVSVFAAFSFVVMMFNLPLPGGTSAHAVGMAIAAIVLGPWGAILAISVALAIQALFFGDGGITTLGANCFNMAVMGSLTAIVFYRVCAWGAAVTSPRRVVAAALAGFAAINVSALLTGIEFGLQPLLFKDADGAPLYAPYPLKIAVPAMMIGHLTIGGLAEMIVTAGLVAYLQRLQPSLAAAHSRPRDCWTIAVGRAAGRLESNLAIVDRPGLAADRHPAWFAGGRQSLGRVGPRGLPGPRKTSRDPDRLGWHRAAGAATGRNGAARRCLDRAFPRLSPPFLKSKEFGYIMAAMLGVGLILAVFLLIGLIVPSRPGKADEKRPGAPESNVLSAKT